MYPRLVSDRWRPAALVAVLVGVAVTTWLAVMFHDRSGSAFDVWAVRTSLEHVGPRSAQRLLRFSEPEVTFAVIGLVALAAALARRWALAVLAVVAPALAVVLTEYVLKPAVGRYISVPGVPEETLRQMFSGAFPSGHETGTASAALIVLVACGQLTMRATARAALVGGLLVWTLLAALGLVRNLYHYATDTIGAVGVSLAVVLGAALVIDLCYARVAERMPARPRQLT